MSASEPFAKVRAGKTPPGSTDWKVYSPDGIYVDVDTSAASFKGDVFYTCSLAGVSSHWVTTGGSCIYNPTSKGFRVYVRYTGPITPQVANNNKWHIQWVGVELIYPT